MGMVRCTMGSTALRTQRLLLPAVQQPRSRCCGGRHACTAPPTQQRQPPRLQPGLQQQQQQRGQHVRCSAAAAAVTPVANAFWPALVHAWNSNPAAVLMGAGAALLGLSLSVFLLAAIPTMLALRRSAHAMERLLTTVEQEVPDTAATLRLSGLELADCIEEVTGLGSDLTEGLRASARAVTSAQQGVQQGVELAGRAVSDYLVPEVKRRAPVAKDALQAALKERASLRHATTAVREAMGATKVAAQRLRVAVGAAALGGAAAATFRRVRPHRRQQPYSLSDPAAPQQQGA